MLAMLNQKFLKMRAWMWLILAGAMVGGLVYYSMNKPVYSTWRYGACMAFLEQSSRFPNSSRLIAGSETVSSATIAYSDTNAYGDTRARVFQCDYTQERAGWAISRITNDRRPLSKAQIARYNVGLAAIIRSEIALPFPRVSARNLEDFRD